MSSLSVFFPCYNDRQTIADLVKLAAKTARKLTRDFEVIVVDDGSTDSSQKLLRQLLKRHKYLRVVFHASNQGYGSVLKTGFASASKDLIFYTDGDGQYDVNELTILYSLMSADISFVQGLKMDRQDFSYRVILGNLYAFAMRWLFMLKTWDVDCDFRLIRREIVKKIELTCTSGAVCVELVKKAEKAKAKFRHVGIHHYARKYGQSEFFKIQKLWETFIELVFLWIEVMNPSGKLGQLGHPFHKPSE